MRRFRLAGALTAMTIVLLSASVACSDDDSAPATEPTVSAEASPASDSFDYNKLTAIVLRPEELQSQVSAATGGFAPGGSGGGVSFTTWYGDKGLLIQSTVGRYSDPVKRESDFDHFRRGIATLTQNETNYDLPGADLAFTYSTSGETYSKTILAFKGEYFMLLVSQSADGTRADEATDTDKVAAYATTVFSRIEDLIADPDSVTPIDGAAKYATPTPGVPAPTPEGVLPTHPIGAATPAP